MKKKMIVSLVLCLLFTVGVFAGCGDMANRDFSGDEVLYVGNTAATTGAYAAVGLPFNIALRAYLEYYNTELKAETDARVELKHFDDGFDQAKGKENTERLVEDEGVFAMVGHFGTPTVSGTLDYLKEMKVPMVYAATGINDLLNEKAEGNDRYILPVQPIYQTEGRSLILRAVTKAESTDPTATMLHAGLGFSKIGIIYTDDDAGLGIMAGINQQLPLIKAISGYEDITVTEAQVGTGVNASDAGSAITRIKNAGVEVLIIAANQAPAEVIINAMVEAELNVPIVSSYVNADLAMWLRLAGDGEGSGAFNYVNIGVRARRLLVNAWVDYGTQPEDYAKYLELMTKYADVEGTGFVINEEFNANDTTDIRNSSFSMAGYIAGATFIHGLQKTLTDNGGSLTRAQYIDAMEAEPFKLPLAGTIDFTGGKRLGITDLNFFNLNLNGEFGEKGEPNEYGLIPGEIYGFGTIDSLMAGLKG